MIIPKTINPKDAVMFDIDDTLINSQTGKIIEDIYELYKNVQKKGYRMVIITARPGFYKNVIWTQKTIERYRSNIRRTSIYTPAK